MSPCIERTASKEQPEDADDESSGARRDAQASCLDLFTVHGQHATGGYHVSVEALQGAHSSVDERLGVLDRLAWLDANCDEGLREVARG